MSCYIFKLTIGILCVYCLICVGAQDAENASSSSSSSTTEASTTVAGTSDGQPQVHNYLKLDNVTTCNSKDERLSECVQKLFEATIVQLKDGNEALGIPAMDPFKLNKTVIQASVGAALGRLTFKNGLVYGFSDTKFKSNEFKENDGKIQLHSTTYVPKIRVSGDYKADMTVNNVHIRPKGKFNLTMYDLNIDQKSEGELYDKDQHRFVRLNKFEAEPTISNLKFNATGIFPDPTLNEIVVNVINQYWKDIYRVLLPETRKYWGPMLLRVFNDAMSVVPYDTFVKEN